MPVDRAFQSAIGNRQSKIPRAFTLIEMLTTVAVLVIVLGLMVSLARDVRTRSAERLTKDLLSRLDTLVEQYRRPLRPLPEALRKDYPIVRPLIDPAAVAVAGRTEEAALRSNAN